MDDGVYYIKYILDFKITTLKDNGDTCTKIKWKQVIKTKGLPCSHDNKLILMRSEKAIKTIIC